jgi:Protein of unknown function (DUF4058)
MPSPFPGMNPFLESPQGWPGVHHWLISELAQFLGISLPSGYYVAIEKQKLIPIEFKEGYLEIRKAGSHQVVTVIEVLSPANKVGEGRLKYDEKRQNVLASRSHLVEIDLLRRGRPMDFSGAAAPTHYRILVSRRQQRPRLICMGLTFRMISRYS